MRGYETEENESYTATVDFNPPYWEKEFEFNVPDAWGDEVVIKIYPVMTLYHRNKKIAKFKLKLE